MPRNPNALDQSLPAILVSYAYLSSWLRAKDRLRYRDWVMDSGAYTAWTKGDAVSLADYVSMCRDLMQRDPTLTEVFALDVIGDWRAGERNLRAMWAAGVPAIPTFHPEEPEDLLVSMARDYPKIAIGGVVGQPKAWKERWVGQIFNRVWPKQIHGLGMTGEQMLLAYPFHSVDASNWEQGPCSFGRWQAYGDMSVRSRDGLVDLRAEVEWYLGLERRAKARWEPERVKQGWASIATVRLATTGGGGKRVGLALAPDTRYRPR